MLPLLEKDCLILQFIAICVIYKCLCFIDKIDKKYENDIKLNIVNIWIFVNLAVFGCIILMRLMISPPRKYPYLHDYIISSFCCIHFVVIKIYLNFKQWL